MLIDLRELLSGSQDEKSYKADIEMNTFNTGSSDYDIIDKPAVDVIIKKLGKNKLSIKADSYVTLSIPCDRCLEPVAVPCSECFGCRRKIRNQYEEGF